MTVRRNIVLIDLENIRPASLESLDREHFEVLLFCGAQQKNISFEIAASLQKLGTRAKYVKIDGNGRNALDFHIAYYMGRIAFEDSQVHFHIISHDKGFDPLIQHLRSQRLLATRCESIEAIPLVLNGKHVPPCERAAVFIAQLKKNQTSRPRTEKAMCSAIKSHFKPGVGDADVALILQEMVKTRFLSIQAGKIVYAASGTKNSGEKLVDARNGRSPSEARKQ